MNENTEQKEAKEQERLRGSFTPIEEEYHAAYPDVKAPWTSAFLSGLFGRNNAGFIMAALIGAAIAVAFWAAYTIFFH
ncbi:hypothetical protein [Effusibacillus dendaii]|uniref:Uncharacterized protein n=1 Tax=Effusibacillus dendaii TaxID=2743772 RepID=A0A7I8D9X7_9BACL|nr:hypothetical protein [Effusibacillus dendaii]BCJ86172.1 hypothetical protein skT53_11570 [Effusibacillus dendaii]